MVDMMYPKPWNRPRMYLGQTPASVTVFSLDFTILEIKHEIRVLSVFDDVKMKRISDRSNAYSEAARDLKYFLSYSCVFLLDD